MLIDTHCHLEKKNYNNLDDEIKDIFASDVGKIIVSGYNIKTNDEAIELADKYDNIYASVGIHPSEVEEIKEEDYVVLEKQIQHKKVVALGEIGLDYYYKPANKEKEKNVFKRQLEIAIKYNKPVIIHNREAFDDIYAILKDIKVKGVFHCFNSNEETANKIIKLGLLLGIGGIITFKNGDKVREVIKNIPIESLVLETDSPYLTPEPNRGKQNSPKYLVYIAKELMNIKNISYAEVCNRTTENATRLFDL
jgi:TatD DNase family protein